MKKSITVILVFILLTSMVSCKKTGYVNGKLLFAGASDGSGIDNKLMTESEYNTAKSVNKVRKEAPETYEIDFNGLLITGTYFSTSYLPTFKTAHDMYKFDNGTIKGGFDIDIYTNSVVSFGISEFNSDRNNVESADYGYDYCLNVAVNLINQLELGNLYQLSSENDTAIRSDKFWGNYYLYSFDAFLDGVKTISNVDVCVNTDGIVCFYAAARNNCLEYLVSKKDALLDLLSKYDEEKAIDEKIRSVYGDNYYDKNITWTLDDLTMTALSDGSIGINYKINIDSSDMYQDCISLFRYLYLP